MNTPKLFNNLLAQTTLSVSKLRLSVSQKSPTILTFVGAVSVIAGTVMACKATMEVPEIKKSKKKDMEIIDKKVENKELSEEEGRTEKGKTSVAYACKTVKLYTPAGFVITAGIISMVASHIILERRNKNLMAAYVSLGQAFRAYRERTKEVVGEEQEKKIRYNLSETEITEIDGDTEPIKYTVKSVDGTRLGEYSPYAIIFDETSTEWTKDPEFNKMFLATCQTLCNSYLRANGFIFLNEVYDMLGFPKSCHTKAGQIVGWIYDPKNPRGDNQVIFEKVFDVTNEASRAFVNGFERSVIIDFNVDGEIIDLFGSVKKGRND